MCSLRFVVVSGKILNPILCPTLVGSGGICKLIFLVSLGCVLFPCEVRQ